MIGGSKGIGLAILQQIQNEYNVYVASRTSENLKETKALHIAFDVITDDLHDSDLPEELHGFVYCPGSINLKPLKLLSLTDFEEDMQLNFVGLVKVVKKIIPRMAQGSSMVFFSSVAVRTGMPYHTSVAAAKGALEGFSKALAAEIAPKIRVNVIAPSLVDTPLAKRLLNTNRKREQMAERHPLERVGTATDIANSTVFLLGDRSSWITGQIIRTDGGISNLKATE